MPSEFDKYLNELSDQEKEALASTKEQVQEAKEADVGSVEQDYQEREGRPLDTNIGGYEQQAEPGSPSEEHKSQVKDSLAQYDISYENEEKESEQEQEHEEDHEF